MNIMELGAIGELVGGVAVIGTLGYLAIQVRQSTKAARSTSYQAAVASVSEWTRCLGSGAALELLFHGASEDPASQTEGQLVQYRYLLLSIVRNYENIHYQYQNGSLDKATWLPWATRIRRASSTPGFREWWPTQRTVFNAAFRELIDSAQPTASTATSWSDAEA